MSKQSEAKTAQNYRREFDCCENCVHFKKDVETYPDYWDKSKTWTRDKNLRCGIGGFKVHKTALCDRHELRVAPSGKPITKLAPRLIHCAASQDGECNHAKCPQLRDNEPETTGRHCPLDGGGDE